MNNWIKVPFYNNWVLNGDGFYISYNEKPMGSDTSETCIVTEDEKFYILDGDWRAEYGELIDSFEKCMKFYNDNAEDFSSCWSD